MATIENKNKEIIKIGFWNIAGLRKKKDKQEETLKKFKKFIKEKDLDIIGIIETWIEEKDWNEVKEQLPQDYIWGCQFATRENPRGRGIGGIISGIKKEIDKKAIIINHENNIQEVRFKIDNETWQVLTIYSNCQIQDLQSKLDKIIEESERAKLIIGGDFNARIGLEDSKCEKEEPDSKCEKEEPDSKCEKKEPDSKCEKEEPDSKCEKEEPDSKCEKEEPDSKCEKEEPDSKCEKEEPDKGERTSKDGIINTEGRRFLEMVKQKGWVILNGNVKGDKSGEFTSESTPGNSVIDYVVGNLEMKNNVRNFKVDKEIISDKHHPVILELYRKEIGKKKIEEKREKRI
ncbi:uncharacterized protein LOC118646393 [Monomorium pharaonis]|uniref:uncharacterized protein LOC118646393 n=1 Tax=Monomorium pharaonis TaxID=307658 RepID=UPI001745FF3E|nr:uncharacterized protein LOC118646393 [Monomorium pharaonis]